MPTRLRISSVSPPPPPSVPRSSSSLNPCRILDNKSSSSNPLESYCWFWDHKKIVLDYPVVAGHCGFCYSPSSELLECPECKVTKYCCQGCLEVDVPFHREYCQNYKNGDEKNKVLEALNPECGSRYHCYKCDLTRKGSADNNEMPCPYFFTFYTDHPLCKVIKGLFDLFIVTLMKHENTTIKTNGKNRRGIPLSVFTHQFHHNDVTSKIVHLYVKMMYDLSFVLTPQMTDQELDPLNHPFVFRKMIVFYNHLTDYHQDFNVFGKFTTENFPWWECYMVNWMTFSEYLLGGLFFRNAIRDCNHVKSVNLMRVEDKMRFVFPTISPDTRKFTVRQYYDKTTIPEYQRCSMCCSQITIGLHIIPWSMEFLTTETKSYPIQRLWPNPMSQSDLLVDIALNFGKIPLGLICSAECLIKLNNQIPGSYKRLLLCSGKTNCRKICITREFTAYEDPSNKLQYIYCSNCTRNDSKNNIASNLNYDFEDKLSGND